jgi:hypothetical protein
MACSQAAPRKTFSVTNIRNIAQFTGNEHRDLAVLGRRAYVSSLDGIR